MNISFVVTSYNYAEYIKETIDSIKNQTIQPFEIIVVDDYSTDNSCKILEEIDGIKLIKHDKNSGQLASIITGLKEATGDYISFIDSDDVILAEYSQVLSDYLNTNDVSLVVCNAEKQEFLNCNTHPFGGWYWKPMSNGMFKKNVLNCILNYKHTDLWKICPDKLLFNIAHLLGNSMNITDKLVYKREHSKNAGKIKNRFWINVKNNLVIRHETYRLINDKEKQNIILKSHSYLMKQIINKIL